MKILNIFKRKYKPILEIASNLGITDSQRIAREFILNEVTPLDKTSEKNVKTIGIDSESDKTVHAIIVSDFLDINNDCNQLALSLARQIALICHYPNFNEDYGSNRTKITIIDVCPNNNIATLIDALKKETNNLLTYCPWVAKTSSGSIINQNLNPLTYIDIELNIIHLSGINIEPYINSITTDSELVSIFHTKSGPINVKSITGKYVNCKEFAYKPQTSTNKIDIYRAMRTNMIYQEGINLIQVQGINEINEYNYPIYTFCKYTRKKTLDVWKKLSIEHKLSSLLCSDCFESRLRSVGKNFFDKKRKIEKQDKEEIRKLAYTEHARWNVEKLILGYTPYTKALNYKLFTSYGDEKRKLIKKLKNVGGANKYHVDLRSCNELIRVNKEDIKYDYFLTLCIPHILKREKNKI